MVSKVAFGIKIDHEGELIHIEFSEEVQRISIPYDAAADLAVDLMEHAKQAHQYRMDRKPIIKPIIVPNHLN